MIIKIIIIEENCYTVPRQQCSSGKLSILSILIKLIVRRMTVTVVRSPHYLLILSFICPSFDSCLFSSQTAMSADPSRAVWGSTACLRQIMASHLIVIQGALFGTFEHYFISLVTVILLLQYYYSTTTYLHLYIYLLFSE